MTTGADGAIAVSLVDALPPKGEGMAAREPRKDSNAKGEQRRQRPNFAHVPTPLRGGRAAGSGSGNGGGNGAAARGGARGFAGGLEDVMRRKGVDEAWNALEEMQRKGTTSDKFSVSRLLMKTVSDGRFKHNLPRIYRCIGLVQRFIDSQPDDVDEVLFNAVLDICRKLRDLSWTESTVQRMRDLGVKPSSVTLGILVKTYGQAGDIQKVLQVWSEMDEQRQGANAKTYGCMIDACVKNARLDLALEILEGMKGEGKHKNTVLYTTLIKGCGLEKDLSKAFELFHEMTSEGVPHNTITYNSILEVCVKCSEMSVAEGLLRDMIAPSSNIPPDLITFSTILKGYCYAGDLEKALGVLESIKSRGLQCDELVYNTLIDGCVKACDIATGVGVFEDMIASGLRPSTVTHSILTKLHFRAASEDEANDAVSQLYDRLGVERPSGGFDSRRCVAADRPGGAKAAGHRAAASAPEPSPTAGDTDRAGAVAVSPSADGASPTTSADGGQAASSPCGGGSAAESPAAMCSPMGGWMQPQGYSFGPMPGAMMPQQAMPQNFLVFQQQQQQQPSQQMSPFPAPWPMMNGAGYPLGGEGVQLVAVPVVLGQNGEPQPQFPAQSAPPQGGAMFFPTTAASSPLASPAQQGLQPQPQMMFMQPMTMMPAPRMQPQLDACGGQWFSY